MPWPPQPSPWSPLASARLKLTPPPLAFPFNKMNAKAAFRMKIFGYYVLGFSAVALLFPAFCVMALFNPTAQLLSPLPLAPIVPDLTTLGFVRLTACITTVIGYYYVKLNSSEAFARASVTGRLLLGALCLSHLVLAPSAPAVAFALVSLNDCAFALWTKLALDA